MKSEQQRAKGDEEAVNSYHGYADKSSTPGKLTYCGAEAGEQSGRGGGDNCVGSCIIGSVWRRLRRPELSTAKPSNSQ